MFEKLLAIANSVELEEAGGISEEVWKTYSPRKKAQYIKEHPNSKYAKEIDKNSKNKSSNVKDDKRSTLDKAVKNGIMSIKERDYHLKADENDKKIKLLEKEKEALKNNPKSINKIEAIQDKIDKLAIFTPIGREKTIKRRNSELKKLMKELNNLDSKDKNKIKNIKEKIKRKKEYLKKLIEFDKKQTPKDYKLLGVD